MGNELSKRRDLTEATRPTPGNTYNRGHWLTGSLNGDDNKAVRESGDFSEEDEVTNARTRGKIVIENGVLFTGPVDEDEIVFTGRKTQIVTKNGTQVFTCFPDLLPELRIKIWKYACYEPRTVDLWQTREHECFSRVHQAHYVYKSHARPPAILCTSHEARLEGMKHYVLDLGTRGMVETPTSFNLIQSYRPIYVNPKCDIICPIPHQGEAGPRSLEAIHERRKNLSYMLSDIGQLDITRIAVHMSDGFYLYKDLFQTLREITLYETWVYPLREKFSSIEPLKLKFKDLESYEDQHYAIKWHGGGKYFSDECALLGCIDTLEELMEPDKPLSDEYSKRIGSQAAVKKAFMELKGAVTHNA